MEVGRDMDETCIRVTIELVGNPIPKQLGTFLRRRRRSQLNENEILQLVYTRLNFVIYIYIYIWGGLTSLLTIAEAVAPLPVLLAGSLH